MQSDPKLPSICIHPPLYLLRSLAQCHECGATEPVVALGVTEFEEDGASYGDSKNPSLYLLSRVETLPQDLLANIQRVAPGYRAMASKTAGMTYFANVCSCGTNFGDFYLFSEPGGAFFPETVEEARQVELSQVPLSGPLKIECSWSEGTAIDMIFEHGTKSITAW